MASYGAKSPMFAPFDGAEPQKSAPVYQAGVILGKLVSCGVTPNTSEGKLPADNSTAEYLSLVVDEDVALETDDLILLNSLILFGAHMSGNDLVFSRGDIGPYGGYAFYHTAMRNGVAKHIGHFFPKVRASRGAKTYNTLGDTIEFGTTQIPMKALFTNAGAIEVESEPFDNETDAYAWCAAKLGVDEYYAVNVQVQGETVNKYVDYVGMCFLPAGEDFTLQITGYSTVVAAYNNGADIKTAITGGSGSYSIQNIAANHEIAIIF